MKILVPKERLLRFKWKLKLWSVELRSESWISLWESISVVILLSTFRLGSRKASDAGRMRVRSTSISPNTWTQSLGGNNRSFCNGQEGLRSQACNRWTNRRTWWSSQHKMKWGQANLACRRESQIKTNDPTNHEVDRQRSLSAQYVSWGCALSGILI